MPTTSTRLFAIERAGETIVLVPQADLSAFAFQQLDAEASEILEVFDRTANLSVAIDCRHTDFFDSAALGFFLKLWQRVRRLNGRMAFYNVSDHEKDILHVTKTDSLWPVCDSKSEALELLRKNAYDHTEDANTARKTSAPAKRGPVEPIPVVNAAGNHVDHLTAGKSSAVSEGEIRLRAYEKWVAAGTPAGDGVDFWIKAEQELRQAK
jgi:anti-anti-sigma factor